MTALQGVARSESRESMPASRLRYLQRNILPENRRHKRKRGRPAKRYRPRIRLAEAFRRTIKRLLQLDFDVDASRQVQLHQCIDGLVGRIHDIHQALVRTDFELVARGLVA